MNTDMFIKVEGDLLDLGNGTATLVALHNAHLRLRHAIFPQLLVSFWETHLEKGHGSFVFNIPILEDKSDGN